jgi:hypothetical protein
LVISSTLVKSTSPIAVLNVVKSYESFLPNGLLSFEANLEEICRDCLLSKYLTCFLVTGSSLPNCFKTTSSVWQEITKEKIESKKRKNIFVVKFSCAVNVKIKNNILINPVKIAKKHSHNFSD